MLFTDRICFFFERVPRRGPAYSMSHTILRPCSIFGATAFLFLCSELNPKFNTQCTQIVDYNRKEMQKPKGGEGTQSLVCTRQIRESARESATARKKARARKRVGVRERTTSARERERPRESTRACESATESRTESARENERARGSARSSEGA